MKLLKTLIITVVIILTTLPVFALGRVTGTSPITNDLTVTVLIPQRVGLDLSGTNVTFDLSDPSVTYPPSAFPGYYFPTDPTTTPHVPLAVFSNSPNGWTLTVIASGDFDATLPVSQLFYAATGEAQTADGTAAPGGNWIAFSATAATNVASDVTRTTGWDDYDQDYELQITGNEAVIDPGATVTITYTLTAL